MAKGSRVIALRRELARLRRRGINRVVFRAVLYVQGMVESPCPYDSDTDVSGPCWWSFPRISAVAAQDIEESPDILSLYRLVSGLQVIRVQDEDIEPAKYQA